MLRRNLQLLPRTPATFVPAIIFPVMLVLALSGGLSGVSRLPDYPVAKQVDWVLPFAVVQSGAVSGMAVGLALIRDLQGGFFDRFLVAPVSRVALIGGFMVTAFFRALVPFAVVTAVGLADGARLPGGLSGFMCLVAANQGAALCGGAWGVGMALRFRSMRAAPLMFMPIFLLVFLAPAQVPLQYLTGWLKPVAKVNPVTQVLDLARAGFVRDLLWGDVWPGIVSLVAMALALGWFALRGLERLSP